MKPQDKIRDLDPDAPLRLALLCLVCLISLTTWAVMRFADGEHSKRPQVSVIQSGSGSFPKAAP